MTQHRVAQAAADSRPTTFIKADEMRAKIYMKRPTANKNDSDFITFGRECRANFLCKLLISKGEDGPPFYRLRGLRSSWFEFRLAVDPTGRLRLRRSSQETE